MKLIKKLGCKQTKYSYGIFKCSYCGNEVEKRLDKGKMYKSCGCHQKILNKKHIKNVGLSNKTHGHSVDNTMSITYRSWCSMLTRTSNPNRTNFKSYGGKGIKVQKRWLKFANFLSDMGERPSEDYEIDRINPHAGYAKWNCRWVLSQDNKKRINKYHPA